jgi:Flp pilus assembly pilin Flp
MRALSKAIQRFFRDERGTETLEWGLICGLIVVGAIAAITVIGPKVTELWNSSATKINAPPIPN